MLGVHERVGDSSIRVNGERCSHPRSSDVDFVRRQVGDELLVSDVFNFTLNKSNEFEVKV